MKSVVDLLRYIVWAVGILEDNVELVVSKLACSLMYKQLAARIKRNTREVLQLDHTHFYVFMFINGAKKKSAAPGMGPRSQVDSTFPPGKTAPDRLESQKAKVVS